MYWWNLRAAKRELSGEPLNSRQLLPYILAFAILETALINFTFLGSASGSVGIWQWVLVLASILLAALGCFYVYRQNGGAKGKRLLERFLVLGWVTGNRYMLFLLLGLVIFIALAAVLPSVSKGVLSDIVFELANPIFYLYLGHHVGDLARNEQAA